MIGQHTAEYHEGHESEGAAYGTSATRRFARSRNDRMIAGVAGGLAQYFGIDPVLVRLGFVLAAVSTGVGLLAYLVLALVTPERGANETEPETAPGLGARHGRQVAGIALLGVGLLTLASNWGLLSWIHWGKLWPAFLVLGGVALLLNRSGRRSY
ncbi:MAG: PspC domain-containing protein [Chloroflexi bacterium]|nr:PspC domain-containing protein [Chloroflexota bacterium]